MLSTLLPNTGCPGMPTPGVSQLILALKKEDEKMMEKGAAALSDAELLAILIGSGNTEESAVELMRRLLLSCDNNLNSLENGKSATIPVLKV